MEDLIPDLPKIRNDIAQMKSNTENQGEFGDKTKMIAVDA
jgi:hypothetical protein